MPVRRRRRLAAATGFGWVCVGLPDRGGARPWWFLAGIVVLAAAARLAGARLVGALARRAHGPTRPARSPLAAPLLAAARPFASVADPIAIVDVVAARDRRPRTPVTARRPVDRGRAVAAAGVVQVGVLLGWHVPLLFDAALRHPPLHDVEHLTLAGQRVRALGRAAAHDGSGAAVIALFVVTLPAMAYGVALTLARGRVVRGRTRACAISSSPAW